MPATQVLLVEDDPGDALLIENAVEKQYPGDFSWTREGSEDAALKRLGRRRFDVCLLDLGLPDSFGFSTLSRLQLLAPELPILILTGNDNEAAGRAAISAGAQDYLFKNRSDGKTLRMAINHAVARKRREVELTRSAQFDELTGLLRPGAFRDAMRAGLARAARLSHLAAVYFIDLDHFKDINDRHGHPAGDALLKTTADRLKQCLRNYDVLARIGGDEFAAFIEDAKSREDCEHLAQRMMKCFEAPIPIGPAVVKAELSIGIVIAMPGPDANAETLLRRADQGMYRAKAKGGGYSFQGLDQKPETSGTAPSGENGGGYSFHGSTTRGQKINNLC